MNNKNDTKDTFIAIAVIIGLLLLLSSCFGGGISSKECDSCGREYSDSANKRSISYRNMCESCYDNYEYVKDMYDYAK